MEYDRSPGPDEIGGEPHEISGEREQIVGASDEADPAGGDREIELLGSIEQDLADVELALERLGDGSYGRCETCGQVIADDELEAAPARRLCRDHLLLDPA